MARQRNPLQLTGILDNMVHYSRNGKYFSRLKALVVQQTENTKKTASEFGRASAGASLLCRAFHPLLQTVPHTHAHTRLTGAFARMIRSGPSHQKGSRLITDGNPSLIKDFRFNPAASVGQLIKGVNPGVTLAEGQFVSFELPSFYPKVSQ